MHESVAMGQLEFNVGTVFGTRARKDNSADVTVQHFLTDSNARVQFKKFPVVKSQQRISCDPKMDSSYRVKTFTQGFNLVFFWLLLQKWLHIWSLGSD